MAILANGVNLQHGWYEFGWRLPNGDYEKAEDFNDAVDRRRKDEKIVMRVIYVTDWQETELDHV
jgi:hypothetical protein